MYICSTLVQRSMNEPSWRSPVPGRPRICHKVTCHWILACKCVNTSCYAYLPFPVPPTRVPRECYAVLVVQDT